MVSLGVVQFMVSAQRALVRSTLHFDSDERLAAVIGATPEKLRNVGQIASWGSLGRGRVTADLLCATDDIVYVGILLMANHCEVLDLDLETQTPFCVVSSHAVEAALAKFDADGRPATGFELPEMPRGLSLLDLRSALATVKKSLECVTFVLHWESHWSLLVYDAVRKRLLYYDSFGNHSRERALVLAALLRSAEIVPCEADVESVALGVQQTGYWQCGYATIAFAAYISGELSGDALVRTVGNDAELVKYVAAMRELSDRKRTVARFVAQNTHWYKIVSETD